MTTFRLAAPMLALVLVSSGCTPAPVVVVPSASAHTAHDPQLDRVRAQLEADGLVFEAAGPHHVVGTDADGNQVDLVGVPVEQVVVTVDASDAGAALVAARRLLPHARDLLHGPRRVWDWADEAFVCRAAGADGCETRVAQGGLEATFTDDGPDFWVLAISRD
ncbi:MAG: hypothetical protein ABI622_08000 [Chloroflexota bacterium]